jgi:hypothetical protein
MDDKTGSAKWVPEPPAEDLAAIQPSTPTSSNYWMAVTKSDDMRFHGSAEPRGINCPRSHHYDEGRFGRLFPLLPPLMASQQQIRDLGAKGGLMDAKDAPPAPNPENPDNPLGLPAGFTFLGQFIDHDITFDPTSSLERQSDPEAIRNFRTPNLELDNVYGQGPGATPHLYQRKDKGGNPSKFLLGKTDDPAGQEVLGDLPRNEEGTALLGDPRNDENRIVSQLHVAFLRFHNAVVDKLGGTVPGVFELAQKAVRWHYQWIIVNEFLPHIVGKPLVDNILEKGRKFYDWRHAPYIPVEFAVATYRFGHSQVRPGYRLSAGFASGIFPGLAGGNKIKKAEIIEWHRFFKGVKGASADLQPSKRIDPKLSSPLMDLPFPSGADNDPKSLAERNLRRHLTFGLPTGQRVARAMKEAPLTPQELSELQPLGLDRNTPLWYYILKEALVRENGGTLGPVGGRIVAEVFIGLLEGDPLSYLREDPDWKPDLFTDGGFTAGKSSTADLLIAAGVAER